MLLLGISLLGFVVAKASGPNEGSGKKLDMNGTVIHGDTKKPLKDVSITAYLVSKKESVVLTDESGNFSFEELKSGIYKFVFEKAGFKRIIKEKVVINADEAFQLNIEMIETSDYDIMPSPFHFANVK